MNYITTLLGLLLILANTCFALEESNITEEKENPTEMTTPVTIATIGDYKSGGVEVDAKTSDITSEVNSDVIGGIHRKSDKCTYTLKNNNEDSSYSIQFKVEERNKELHNSILARGSERLKPGESIEKSVRCNPEKNISLSLTSLKKI